MAVVLATTLLVPVASANGPGFSPAADPVQFLYNEYTTKGAKNNDAGVGAYAYYILTQAGVDVSGWFYKGQSLVDAVYGFVEKGLTLSKYLSAKLLAQDLLAAKALNREDMANQLLDVLRSRQSSQGFDKGDFSTASNLAAYDLLGRAGLFKEINSAYAKEYILSTQNKDRGCWGFEWGGAYYPDFMCTAQAIRALHYLDPAQDDPSVQEAIYAGLDWLKSQQKEDGRFEVGRDDPIVDTAEAIITFKVLGQDSGEKWEKAVDYLLNINNESFWNAMDATWLLAAFNFLNFYLEPYTLTLQPGEKDQLKAVWRDVYGQSSDVTPWATWSVADSSIASVDDKGLVTAIKAGQTVVSAVYNGLTAWASLTVQSAAGGGGSATAVTVEMAVVGASGELLFGPSYVTVSKDNKWGLTVLGALDASGLPYHTSDWSWGVLVDNIAGQANSGMAGWMYVVNDQLPSFGPEKYNIKDGDKIIWYYSKSMDQQPPKWEDLVKQGSSGGSTSQGSSGGSTSTDALKNVEKALEDLKGSSIDLSKALASMEQVAKLKEADLTAELKNKVVELISTVALSLGKLPDKAVEVQVQGEKAEVKIDGSSITSQVDIIKKAADLSETLKNKGIANAGDLQQKVLVAQLPQEISGKDFTVLLPAEAARALVSNGLAFKLQGSEVTFTLPAKAVNTILEAASNVAQLAVSAGKITADKVNLPKGTLVVPVKVINLDLVAVTPEGAKEKPKTNFGEKITITVSLEGIDTTKVNIKGLDVYRQKRDASWEYVGGTISPDGKSISFKTEHTSIYAIMDYRKTFADVSSHWAKNDIEYMAKRLIARGVAEDLFAPDSPVTRAQFTTFLVRALGLEEERPAKAVFLDLPQEHWAYGAVAVAFKEGLVFGVGEGKFAPEEKITREEMAAMLLRVLERKGVAPKMEEKEINNLLAHYTDSNEVSSWAKNAMASAVKVGLVQGKPQNLLAPRDRATRAEAMVFLKRLLDRYEG